MSGQDHPFFGPASAETLPTLAGIAGLLIERVLPSGHEWQRQAQADAVVLLGDITPCTDLTATTLDRVKAALQSAAVISEAPEAACLAFRVLKEEHRGAGNQLTAWVLAAAMRRRLTAPGENVIAAGLDATRLLKTRATGELSRLAPIPATPEDLLARLEAAAAAEELSTKVRRYFVRIAALIRAAHAERDPIFRDRSAAGEADHGAIAPQAREAIEGVIEIAERVVPQAEGFAGPIEVQQADQVADRRAVQAKDDPASFAPRKVAQRHAAKAARHAARRDLALTAEQDPLTAHEVAVLMGWLEANDWHDAGHATLLADLVFGAARERKGGVDLERDRSTGRHDLFLEADVVVFDSLVEEEEPAPGRGLCLPGPSNLLICPDSGEEANRVLHKILKTLRPKLARPLTRRRILRYKEDWLRRAGADAATIGFLTAKAPSDRAQMHYTSLKQQTLLDWHHRYLREALGISPVEPRPGGVVDGGLYGSDLRLPLALLRDVFGEFRRDLRRRALPGIGSFEQVADAHNAFASYTLMVLYFATGHRPVTHPFEFRSDFDLAARLLWISDKAGRGARGARLIVLPPCAEAQVRHWIAHLERLDWRLSLTHPELAAAARAALAPGESARGPFLFRLAPDGSKVHPFRPAIQKQALDSVLPAALNWTRHVLRSALAETCDPAALDAMMGHGHLGEEPFAAGSALRLADLYALAEQVERILADHGVTPMESPL